MYESNLLFSLAFFSSQTLVTLFTQKCLKSTLQKFNVSVTTKTMTMVSLSIGSQGNQFYYKRTERQLSCKSL